MQYRRFNDLRRIDKRVAKRLYNAGEDIFLIPCNLNPDNGFGLGMWQNKNDWGQFVNFEELATNYTWYNCNTERGRYVAFYVKVNRR